MSSANKETTKVPTINLGPDTFEEFTAAALAKGEEKYASLLNELFSPQKVHEMLEDVIANKLTEVNIPYDKRKFSANGIKESEAWRLIHKQFKEIPIFSPSINSENLAIHIYSGNIRIRFNLAYLEPEPEPELELELEPKSLLERILKILSQRKIASSQIKVQELPSPDQTIIDRINNAAHNLILALENLSLKGVDTEVFAKSVQEIIELFEETGGQRAAIRSLIATLEGTGDDFAKFLDHPDHITNEHKKDLTVRFQQEVDKAEKIKNKLIENKISDAHLGVVIRTEKHALHRNN